MKKSAFYSYAENLADASFLQKVIEIVQPKPDDHLLDLGTGKGYTAIAFAPLVKSVIAIDQEEIVLNRFNCELKDLDKEEILIKEKNEKNILNKILRELYLNINSKDLLRISAKVDIQQLRAENLNDYADNTFDIVTCRAALHHFENPLNILREVNRILKPNGKFEIMDGIFSENSRDIWSAITRMKELDYKSYYTYQELLELFTEGGFLIEIIFPFRFKRTFNSWVGTADERIKDRLYDAITKVPEFLKHELNIRDTHDNLNWDYNCFEALLLKNKSY